ncbi:MAG: response regulator [Deltaproteobacteria bacterium]|nr:response regulator [Deltaproteobacteria bacterium]
MPRGPLAVYCAVIEGAGQDAPDAGARILLVEDDATVRTLVSAFLSKLGFVVDTANDGQEALKKAEESLPNVIVTDIMMPKMDGWDLVRRLRQDPRFCYVPIIFLTVHDSPDEILHGFRLGANEFLTKPFRMTKLARAVKRAIRRTSALARMHESLTAEGKERNLSGSLSQLSLATLLTVLNMEKRSGVIAVMPSDNLQVARLFLCAGEVVQAKLDGVEAIEHEQVLYLALGWQRGHFEYKPAEIDMEDFIESSVTHIIMESARRLDEANRT